MCSTQHRAQPKYCWPRAAALLLCLGSFWIWDWNADRILILSSLSILTCTEEYWWDGVRTRFRFLGQRGRLSCFQVNQKSVGFDAFINHNRQYFKWCRKSHGKIFQKSHKIIRSLLFAFVFVWINILAFFIFVVVAMQNIDCIPNMSGLILSFLLPGTLKKWSLTASKSEACMSGTITRLHFFYLIRVGIYVVIDNLKK